MEDQDQVSPEIKMWSPKRQQVSPVIKMWSPEIFGTNVLSSSCDVKCTTSEKMYRWSWSQYNDTVLSTKK